MWGRVNTCPWIESRRDGHMTRRKLVVLLLLLFCLGAALPSLAQRGGRYSGKSSASRSKSSNSSGKTHVRSYTRKDGTVVRGHDRSLPHRSRSSTSSSRRSETVPRSSVGRSHNSQIKRNEETKRQFMRQTGFPHGRKGYVVDHVVPLACGGADTPSNMQWQTEAEAKAKDKWERNGCKQ